MDKDFLKSLFGDQEGVLSESAQTQLTEAIKTKVDEVAEERVKLAEEAIDKSHSEMLQQLVENYETKIKTEKETLEESLDITHAEKVKEAFTKLDESYASKLTKVSKHYDCLLNEGVKEQTSTVVEAIDSFLDNWLDEKVPTKFIEEAAKKDYSQELLKKISNLVGYNETVNEDVRDAMKDAQALIERQKSTIDKLEKDSFLKEHTENLPVLERQTILESFSDEKYDFDFVKRNFEFKQKQILNEKQTPSTFAKEKTSAQNVDRPKPQVITEGRQVDKEEVSNSVVTGFAKQLATGSGIYNS